MTKPQGSLDSAAPVVRQPAAGCSYSAASWSPTGRIVVGQTCAGGSAEVLLLPSSPGAGTPVRLATLPDREAVNAIDYDVAGSALLLEVTFDNGSSDRYVARVVGDRFATVIAGPGDPHWS